MTQISSPIPVLFKGKRLSSWNRCSFSNALQFSVAGSLLISNTLLLPSVSYSQALPSYAPTAFQPQFEAGTSNFNIESGIVCPSTTFNVTGFGGNLNAWGDTHYSPYQSTSASAGNYGIAAGLSIPLSRAMSDYCRKYAEGRIKAQETLVRNQLMNSQFALFKHCKYFKEMGYTLDEKEFKDNAGPLSVFSACSSLARLLDPSSQLYPKTSMDPVSPRPASTAPISSPPQETNVNLFNRK